MTNGIVMLQDDNPPTIDIVGMVTNDTKSSICAVSFFASGDYTTESADGYPTRK
jgi:hypothetical protein